MPAYYAPYLASVAAKVNARAARCVDGFWFLTDPHVGCNRKVSGHLLAALTPLTPLKKTLCGGDLTEAFAGGYSTAKAGVDFAVETYRALWRDPIEASGQLLYNAKGNHDFTIRLNPTADDGFTYSAREARDRVMDTNGCRQVVTNAADPTACYYYFDNAAAKVRYIVADTTDSINPNARFWAVANGIHDTQLRWLADHALSTLPEGWGAVVMHHIPITGCVGSEGERNQFAPFRQLLEGYQNREVVTVAGKVYNFTHAQGRILLDITGHHHAERQTFQRGILHVTEPCDAAYGDYINGSQPWCGDLPQKRGGTVYEQTFDAVQLDPAHDRVYFTRVGGGQDRVIHTRARTVKVGEQIAFAAPELAGPLTWGCYDADRITHRPNPQNKYSPFVDYARTVGTIDAQGVFTALKPGEMMVMARDAQLNKEIFPVTVV